MTDRQIARMCIRGGFGCLALMLACLLGWWLGMQFFCWAAG